MMVTIDFNDVVYSILYTYLDMNDKLLNTFD